VAYCIVKSSKLLKQLKSRKFFNEVQKRLENGNQKEDLWAEWNHKLVYGTGMYSLPRLLVGIHKILYGQLTLKQAAALSSLFFFSLADLAEISNK
jgi:hypothetical protein